MVADLQAGGKQSRTAWRLVTVGLNMESCLLEGVGGQTGGIVDGYEEGLKRDCEIQ